MTSATSISKSLELLDKSRMFEVKCESDYYDVTFKDDPSDYPLSATYDEERGWSYYIGGVYDNGTNWVMVDVAKLNALMSFCESLSGDAR